MTALCDDTPFGERFKDPLGYLHNRQRTEQWVRAEFIAKGGQPVEPYPIYMVLGFSPWIRTRRPGHVRHRRDPHSACRLSRRRRQFHLPRQHDLALVRPTTSRSEYYQPDYHGKVFTRSEILAIVAARGLPEEGWEPRLPDHLAPYIEAQVWNREPLLAYQSQMQAFL